MDVITGMLNRGKEDKLDQSDGLDSYSMHAGRSNINIWANHVHSEKQLFV